MQPSYFVEDTKVFLGQIEAQIDKINDDEDKKTPVQKKDKTENEYQKEQIVEHLENNNREITEKMH